MDWVATAQLPSGAGIPLILIVHYIAGLVCSMNIIYICSVGYAT
jgi:hypothetical protein